MYKIAQGIRVHYNNQKGSKNTVFFSDGTFKEYPDGVMLYELISDEVLYMLTDKVVTAIKTFPDSQSTVTSNSITECFKWICCYIEDEEYPVASSLFQSCFSDYIGITAANAELSESATVQEFFIECYSAYLKYIMLFCLFVGAVAAYESEIADDDQQKIAETFISTANEYQESYSKPCSLRHKDGQTVYETVQVTNFLQLHVLEYCRMKKKHTVLKECANCGRLFIPKGRIDTKYCFCPDPDNPQKMCSETGAAKRRIKKRHSDDEELKHHNTMCQLYNMIRRLKESGAPDNLKAHYNKELNKEMTRHYEVIDNNKE